MAPMTAMEPLIATPPRRVARVAVDVPLPHLDRVFDYEVPEKLDQDAVPGARVRVRFAGRLVDGFVLERGTESDVESLAPLQAAISAEPVLTPEIARLVRRVADHYAGTFAYVVRLAVAPRHARTEKAAHAPVEVPEPGEPAGPLTAYPWGSSFLAALERGDNPRAAWQAVPVTAPEGDWATAFAHAALAVRRSGRSSVLLAPDARDLARLGAACDEVLGVGTWVLMSADAGPAERYRAYLAALRGEVDVVIGSRAAVWAPVRDVGLVALWDDGDDVWSEPRAPYPHAREVACLRATGCALLLASHARTAEVEALVQRGWITSLGMRPDDARRVAPVVRAAVDSDRALRLNPHAAATRLPPTVFETIRSGLARGAVLVQVPRTGGRLSLVCQTCREPARCPHCSGPLVEPAEGEQLVCHWCAHHVARASWRCPHCQGTGLRARRVGASRTAAEIGRAFPGIKTVQSAGARIVAEVAAEPSLVVATPGGEPVCPGGYAAAVLLDGDVLLGRADLRADEEALRRWSNATALVQPAEAGGAVTLVAEATARPVQALVRHDPVGFASLEVADRGTAGFPPAVKMVSLEGEPGPVSEITDGLALPEDSEVFGPVPVEQSRTRREANLPPTVRVLLRSPLGSGRDLVAAVAARTARRSAAKAPGAVRVRVDPSIIA